MTRDDLAAAAAVCATSSEVPGAALLLMTRTLVDHVGCGRISSMADRIESRSLYVGRMTDTVRPCHMGRIVGAPLREPQRRVTGQGAEIRVGARFIAPTTDSQSL